MALSEIIQEINRLKPLAEEKLNGGPMETLAARKGRKIQSYERLNQLKTQYTRELTQSAVFILVTGSLKDEFTRIASEEFSCFSADPEGFYVDLASRVPSMLYMGKEGLVNLFEVIGRHLEDKALELDILGYPMLLYKEKYRKVIGSKGEFITMLKRAINDQIGAEISGINAVKSVVDTAIERGHSAKTTPIVMATSDEQLVVELIRDLERLTSKVFLVTVGKSSKTMKSIEGVLLVKEPTNESVEKVLTEVKNSIKK